MVTAFSSLSMSNYAEYSKCAAPSPHRTMSCRSAGLRKVLRDMGIWFAKRRSITGFCWLLTYFDTRSSECLDKSYGDFEQGKLDAVDTRRCWGRRGPASSCTDEAGEYSVQVHNSRRTSSPSHEKPIRSGESLCLHRLRKSQQVSNCVHNHEASTCRVANDRTLGTYLFSSSTHF